MGMFDEYDFLNTDCNTHPLCSCDPINMFNPCRPNKPYEEYDVEGKLIGYYWYHKDTINLEFNIEGEITLVDDTIYEPATDFMQGKSVTITFYDFRDRLILTKNYSSEDIAVDPTKIIFEIDKDISKDIFVRGNYYCIFAIWEGEDLYKVLLSQNDCTFTVK